MFINSNKNGTVTGAPNSCSYADIAVVSLNQVITEKKEQQFRKCFILLGIETIVKYCGMTHKKLQELYNSLNTLNPDLKFTMEIGNQSICFLDLRISVDENKLIIIICYLLFPLFRFDLYLTLQ